MLISLYSLVERKEKEIAFDFFLLVLHSRCLWLENS